MESASDDAEFAGELIGMFMDQARLDLAEIAGAALAGDAGAVAKVSHRMVGSCVACGFTGLSKALRALELQCKEQMPNDIDARIAGLERMLVEGHEKMQVYLGGD